MKQLCTFSIGGTEFAVDAARVVEVLGPSPLTRVPMAPDSVRGLVQLRGRFVTVVDPRITLGMPSVADITRTVHLVLRGPHGVTSLLVDHVSDIVAVQLEALDLVPRTLPTSYQRLLSAIHTAPERTLLILDADCVLERALATTPAPRARA